MRKPNSWMTRVMETGPSGVRWCDRFGPFSSFVQEIGEAVAMMRGGRLEAGEQLVLECARSIRQRRTSDVSIQAVLDRWLFGAYAYLNYCKEDFPSAYYCLDRAEKAVVTAVSKERILLVLSRDCMEFMLHRARIARQQRLWPRMNEYIDAGRMMIRDQIPLFATEFGTRIYWSDITCSHDKPGGAAGCPAGSGCFPGDIEYDFDCFVRQIERLPDFAVQY